jgi:hypothetical protein
MPGAICLVNEVKLIAQARRTGQEVANPEMNKKKPHDPGEGIMGQRLRRYRLKKAFRLVCLPACHNRKVDLYITR